MPVTDISICSQACVLLGAGEISSFEDDETDRALICKNTYPVLRDGILSKYPWRFLMSKTALTRDATDPINEWAYSFVLPGSVISGAPTAVFYNAADRMASGSFEIFGRRLYTNEALVWVDAVETKSESAWPPYFVLAVQYALMAEIAYALTDQAGLATFWHQKAYGTPEQNGLGGALGDAMTLDAQGSANIGLENDAFVNARAGGYPADATDFTWPG